MLLLVRGRRRAASITGRDCETSASSLRTSFFSSAAGASSIASSIRLPLWGPGGEGGPGPRVGESGKSSWPTTE